MKPRFATGLVALAFFIGLWAGPANALPVPVSSSMGMTARANAGGGVVTDSDSDSQGGTVNPLAVSVSALATSGDASVLTTGDGTATWVDSSQGSVSLFNIGWTTALVSDGLADVNTGGPDWSYTFISDVTGLFTLGWLLTGTGDTFGLNGFSFDWTDGGDFFDVTSSPSGSLTRAIVAGNTYTASLTNAANISGGLGTRTAVMTGDFDWNITGRVPTPEVPEPSTWLLLGSGLAGLAAWKRKRNA